MAVDDVEREEERDFVRRFLHRDPLQGARPFRSSHSDEGAHEPTTNLRLSALRHARARLRPLDGRHRQLTHLLLECEERENGVDEAILASVGHRVRERWR